MVMRISLAAPKVGSLCRSQVGSVRAVYDRLGAGSSPRLPDRSLCRPVFYIAVLPVTFNICSSPSPLPLSTESW